MLRRIANVEGLLDQATELEKKRFKPGFDGMTTGAAVMWLKINGEQLTRRLLRGVYEPMPVVGFRSAKRDGGHRQLAKLSVIDMIVHNTIISIEYRKGSRCSYDRDSNAPHFVCRWLIGISSKA